MIRVTACSDNLVPLLIRCDLDLGALLPPGCELASYNQRCGQACSDLDLCMLSAEAFHCRLIPGERTWFAWEGAWNDGAGAVQPGHVQCVKRPPDACVRCIAAQEVLQCERLAAGACRAECGEMEAIRPLRLNTEYPR
jgi:hypothetical protein